MVEIATNLKYSLKKIEQMECSHMFMASRSLYLAFRYTKTISVSKMTYIDIEFMPFCRNNTSYEKRYRNLKLHLIEMNINE